jgi:hypothetical protein
MNAKNCRQTAAKEYLDEHVAQGQGQGRLRTCSVPHARSGQIKETAGVVLAAVFTVIAAAGTILQFVAYFR